MQQALKRQEGQALIVAVLISLAVVLIGLVALGMASHNSSSSAQNRKRVQAIAAGEAGVNLVYSHLQTATPSTLGIATSLGSPCADSPATSYRPLARDLDSANGIRFTVSVKYFTAAGAEILCPNSAGIVPARAVITSIGQGFGTTPRRTMESTVNLTAIRGGSVTGSALYSQSSISMSSNMSLFGGTAQNADIYTDGDFSGSTNQRVQGSVFAQGSITVTGSGGVAGVARDLYAKVGVSNPNGHPVQGNVTASTGNIVVGGPIGGTARAGGTITGSVDLVSGTVTQNLSGIAAPPVRTFPARVFNEEEYRKAAPEGWGPNTQFVYFNPTGVPGAACNLAATYVTSTLPLQTVPTVVRVTEKCTVTMTSGFTVRNHFAILVNGGIDMRGQIGRDSSAPTPTFVVIDTGLTAGAPCDFVLRSNSSFATGMRAVIRSGCNATFASNGNILDGQIFARGTLGFSSNTTMTFYAVDVPGAEITGFRQDIIYIREIPTPT